MRHCSELLDALQRAYNILGMSVPGTNAFWAYLKNHFPEDNLNDFLQSPAYRVLSQLEAFLKTVGVPRDLMWKMPCSVQTLAITVPILLKTLDTYITPEADVAQPPTRPIFPDAVNVSRVPANTAKQIARQLRGLQHTLKVYYRSMLRTCDYLLSAFKGYLDVVVDSRLINAVTQHYLASLPVEDPSQEEEEECQDLALISQPSISAKKASITLDTIDGHGPWKIVVSNRLVDNLRASKKRPQLFSKVKNTFRWALGL